ncbi:MAG TPA: glycerol-3-phosphate 1-O-acyltransferase PlsY [Bacillota bacterium]|nr:glycerol-3-phosphate 1-O-acyltransferase PlsY [Bacillota bacterium]
MLPLSLVSLAGYLIGGLPFGYWTGRLWGVDIRRLGSGNVGATNVFRVLGPFPGLMVLLADAGKGIAAAFLAQSLAPDLAPWSASLAGLAAVAGHTWPWALGFRGGKGVATAAGVALFLLPGVIAASVAVMGLTALITRYVSLGSLLGAATAALMVAIIPTPLPHRLFIGLAVVLIYVRHIPNIRRLLAGRELKLGGSRR